MNAMITDTNMTSEVDESTTVPPTHTTIEFSEYRMLGIGDILSKPVDVGWLVEDLVPLQSVGMVFGASGVGKSHIMLSMALNVAMGRSWFGKDVVQGSVAVLVGEGAGGINKRLQAIAKEHNLPLDNTIPITFSDMPIGIDSEKGFNTVVKTLDQSATPPNLIIVDTLSRHISESKENDNGDMAKFINRLDALKKRYNATVIFVHHTGKSDQDSARGAYALKANVDFSFSVKGADKSKLISLECDKMKDGDDNLPPMRFKVIGVEVGTNSKGKSITGACVIAANDADFKATIKLSDNRQLAVDTFNPDLDKWREAFVSSYPSDIERASKVKAFSRELKELEKLEKVVKGEGGVYELQQLMPQADTTDSP